MTKKETIKKLIDDWMNSYLPRPAEQEEWLEMALGKAYEAGEDHSMARTKNTLDHEAKKMTDGFAHPKDCEECKQDADDSVRSQCVGCTLPVAPHERSK